MIIIIIVKFLIRADKLYIYLTKFYILTDTWDALSGMSLPRTQTYLNLRISEVFAHTLDWCQFGFDL